MICRLDFPSAAGLQSKGGTGFPACAGAGESLRLPIAFAIKSSAWRFFNPPFAKGYFNSYFL
jgi:hypothetical protein